MTLTREQVLELLERSKSDRALIVGSEVRQLCNLALQALEMRPRPIAVAPRDGLVFAWTETGGYHYYPQFLNISIKPEAEKLHKRKGVAVYIRGPEAIDNEGSSEGFTAQIVMPIADLHAMARAILTSLPEPRR